MLIYTPLIGNSRVPHLNRILNPVASAGTGTTWEGDDGRGRDGIEGRVSVNGSFVVSVPADRTEFGVRACIKARFLV